MKGESSFLSAAETGEETPAALPLVLALADGGRTSDCESAAVCME